MSSVFEVPVHLIVTLTLAASAAGVGREPQAIAARLERTAAEQTASASPSPTSPAGPFLFSEQRWLWALRRSVSDAGPGSLVSRIFVTSSGRYYAPAESDRRIILALRYNYELAEALARWSARYNARRLTVSLGRSSNPGELYLAQLLGVEVAADLIRSAHSEPTLPLAARPAVAAGLTEIAVRTRAGTTVADVYQLLTSSVDGPLERVGAFSANGTVIPCAVRREASSKIERNDAPQTGDRPGLDRRGPVSAAHYCRPAAAMLHCARENTGDGCARLVDGWTATVVRAAAQ